ncbi:MAG: AMIN domain-containing protein, partial [Chromatiales bacterium]
MNRGSRTQHQVIRLLAGLCLWLAGHAAVCAEAVDFKGVRLWAAPDHTRVVFDTSGSVTHKIFSLQNPDRLVIDVASARVATSMKAAQGSGGLVKGVRTAHKDKDTLRIVLDLTQGAKPQAFSLKPNEQYGHRLVIDLYEVGKPDNQAAASAASAASEIAKPAPVKTTTAAAATATPLRELVIAIDA